MDIDTIQCPPSSLYMSDLNSCHSTPPSPLPPPINKRPNIVPLPLLDPEEEAEHAEIEEFQKAREMGNAYLSGRVSNLSKKVTAYACNFLMDWLMSQKEENPINDWDSKISSQPSWTGTASSTSSPPSYKSEKCKLQDFDPSEDTKSLGEGWFRNPRSDQVGLPFLIKYKGYWVEAPWVTYDFSPACPQFLASMGKDHWIQARPLRPKKVCDNADIYSANQMHLFDEEDALVSWVDEAVKTENNPSLKAGITQYCFHLFHKRESEECLRQVMTTYGTTHMHRLESLQHLEAADAFDRLSTQIRWANHFNKPSENPAALKSWNLLAEQLACSRPHPKLFGHTSSHAVIPKTHQCKMCYKCSKHGHIRATCPSRPIRKCKGYM
jgi:hypothetical protein